MLALLTSSGEVRKLELADDRDTSRAANEASPESDAVLCSAAVCIAVTKSTAVMSAACLKSAAGICIAGFGATAFVASSQSKPQLTGVTPVGDAARCP
jgi:hypothetical protein